MHIVDNIFESILYMIFYDPTHDILYSDSTHISYAAVTTQ